LADRVLVIKSERILRLYAEGQMIREYRIALGKNPVGPKKMQGDGKTPEGDYRITGKNPTSSFHLSLRISYPDSGDLDAARRGDWIPAGTS